MPELKKQLEKIMDEAEGAYADVIVQFKSEKDKSLSRLLEVVVDTERGRAMMVDPAKILPPVARAFDGSQRARTLLRKSDASLAANIALDARFDALRGVISVDVADNFLNSDIVSRAVHSAKSRLRGKAKAAEPMHLDNIGGVRMVVHKQDLPGIIDEKKERVEGIYENFHIKAPRLFEASAAQLNQDEPYDGTTWGLRQTRALAAWSTFGTRGLTKNGTPVRVAVLDTGVDPDHPDIKGRLVDFAEFNGSGTIVNSGVANAFDSDQHGTHVAGTIVGGNASGGWIGMAPDAELISGLVLDGKKGGTLAQVIKGIEWAVQKNAHVINLSLGGLSFESTVGTPYQRAIVDALVRGTLVVAAIGNDGHQTTGAPGNDYFSLAVGAHDSRQRCAGFSGGRTLVLDQSSFIDSKHLPLVYTKPDLSAPGVAVKSSMPKGKWASLNGTSMATPHVSGAAALLFAATDLTNSPADQRAFLVKDLLLGGVTDLGEAGQDQRFGYGTINVLRSIDEALKRGF